MDSYHLVSRIGQGLPRLPFRQLPNTMHTRASSAQAALQLNLELFESDLPDPQQTLDPEPNPGFGKLPLELRYVRSIGLRPSLYLDEIGPANDFEQINDLATLLPTTTQGSFHGSPTARTTHSNPDGSLLYCPKTQSSLSHYPSARKVDLKH